MNYKIKLPPFISHLKVRHHAQARTLKLHMDPLRKIPVLTLPPRCTQGRVESFLHESRPWLEQQIENHKVPEQITALEIMGESYQLIYDSEVTKSEVRKGPAERQLLITGPSSIEKIILCRFLKNKALEEAQKVITGYAQQLNVSVRKIDVKEYVGRWGCCYKRGDIFISWRLVMAPREIFNYVCAHETAHLIHHNHSPQFWGIVHSLLPSYKEAKRWLKYQGKTLFSKI